MIPLMASPRMFDLPTELLTVRTFGPPLIGIDLFASTDLLIAERFLQTPLLKGTPLLGPMRTCLFGIRVLTDILLTPLVVLK